HRVLHADGTCATHKSDPQLDLLLSEGVPVRNGRVDMRQARWDGTRGTWALHPTHKRAGSRPVCRRDRLGSTWRHVCVSVATGAVAGGVRPKCRCAVV